MLVVVILYNITEEQEVQYRVWANIKTVEGAAPSANFEISLLLFSS